ncbi:carbamoyl phosphate synthase small subunit [Jeotgalibacillus malaysiensis]|uniref:Carbamoyl phosphate synthase small chain n=1 Tax=Jeotgalibacillus malaysiensis TaxID=1508404 RepID=A0A0B5AKX4_9BACL|nr:carbamoyl phosphate synthase small subunit [Jeotgalibacillus malaysiensis]AJD90935.1 carbamoyl phosphate synthase small subunit [Jeotgalibacillus malaysiensis]
MTNKLLILEDGSVFKGEGFGWMGDAEGEVVFNTGMTGYQEILSDPSYCAQMVVLTYPLIGNYGINRDDFESIHPYIKALIVREACDLPSNFRSEASIDDLLKEKKIPGLSGIDTRRLTKLIRSYGTMKGRICEETAEIARVVSDLKSSALATDQVSRVSTKSSYPSPGRGKRVVVVDYGMKHGILRELNRRQCDVIVVPYHTSAKEILRLHPDGVVLSNGPGDPKSVPESVKAVKELIGAVPIFGICLGHQLLALAGGADTFKLKFGHRGSNHPVKDIETGKVAITAQNHGYAVDEDSLLTTDFIVTHKALNDGTVEGIKHREHAVFSVQYHPEASPGPEDANELFDRFIQLMKEEEIQYA